jgi:Phage gp6-like head-tail connector protein
MGNLVTLADVKTYLQIGFSTDDGRLNLLIAGISADIEKYTRKPFSAGVAAVTDILDGGYRELVLSTRPVVSVTSITDRTTSTVVDSSTYETDLASGMVLAGSPDQNPPPQFFAISQSSQEPLWDWGRRRWEVIYQAGWAAVPADVQDAAFMEVKRRYSGSDGIKSERIGDYGYTMDTDPKTGLSAEVMRKLAPYVEPIL